MLFEKETAMKPQVTLILVEISGEEFAIDLLEVKEIIREGQIRRLPKGFDFVEGIYNYRGNIIHIIDPKKKLKIADHKLDNIQSSIEKNNGSEKRYIIIISLGNDYIGFLVDQIISIVHVDSDAIEALSPIVQTNVNSECIRGIIKFKDRPRVWLNLKTVLTDSEQISIKKSINKID